MPKPGKTELRPLDIRSQKVVQKALEIALQALWEGEFSTLSHGFRPVRRVSTAIQMVKQNFSLATYVVEGDIKNAFGEVNHAILMGLLSEKIKCKLTLKLILNLLTTGYIDKRGVLYRTKVGIPQGSIPGPVLFNIYLHNFDLIIGETVGKIPISPKKNYEY